MSIDAESYRRVRGQVTFLMSVVELLANSIDPESSAARAARRVVELTRLAIAVTEQSADTYASIANQIDNLLSKVELIKAEGRAPSNLEWESLRSEMETTSGRIAIAAADASDAGDGA